MLTPKRKTRAEHRRQQLLSAARTVFSREGFSGASIRTIAREAGVTEGLVYHYFDNKEALFEDVLKEYSFSLTIQRIMQENAPPTLQEAVYAVLKAFLELHETSVKAGPMLMHDFHRNPACARIFRQTVHTNTRSFAEFLERYRKDGQIREEVDCFWFAGALLGLTFSLIYIWGTAPSDEWRVWRTHYLEIGVRILLLGVVAPEHSAPILAEITRLRTELEETHGPAHELIMTQHPFMRSGAEMVDPKEGGKGL